MSGQFARPVSETDWDQHKKALESEKDKNYEWNEEKRGNRCPTGTIR